MDDERFRLLLTGTGKRTGKAVAEDQPIRFRDGQYPGIPVVKRGRRPVYLQGVQDAVLSEKVQTRPVGGENARPFAGG